MLASRIFLAKPLLFLAATSVVQPAKAQDVQIVSMILGQGLQQADGGGFYGSILTTLLERAKAPAAFSVYPFKRALRVFSAREADCIWALDVAFLRQLQVDVTGLKESASVLRSAQYLFTAAGAPPIGDLGDLRGKTIGVLNGANTERLFAQYGATIVKLPDQETKLRMLTEGRLDIVGGWTPDMYVTMQTLGFDPSAFEASYKVADADVRLVCHDTPKTAPFIEDMNRTIGAFLRSGAYYDILGRYGALEHLD